MKYCYIDESGNPSPKNNKPFIVGMVVLESLEEVEMIQEKIKQLKEENGIARDYEFHFSRNASSKKDIFILFIEKNIKSYSIFEAQKSNSMDTYFSIADMVASSLSKDEKYNIRLDTNPKLFKALRKSLRGNGISAKLTQVQSKNNDLIQVADYIAGIAAKGMKLKKLP